LQGAGFFIVQGRRQQVELPPPYFVRNFSLLIPCFFVKSPRVLMLPKWYPNRYDDQDGDFVGRHVAAIAAFGGAEVAVLFAAVARGPLPGLISAEEDFSGPWPTLRYYYRAAPTGWAVLDKPIKLLLYFWCLLRGYRRLRQHWGGQRPDIVHVHILLRTGLFAWGLQLLRGIPFVITEQWTLYLPLRSGGISWLRRVLTRAVVRRSAALHTVSEMLRDAMAALGFVNANPVVIANVIDVNLFRLRQTLAPDCPNPAAAEVAPGPSAAPVLLHVSAFHDQVKNLSGVLRVVSRLREKWPALQLRIVGYGPDEQYLHEYAASLGLLANGTATFLGKCPHPEVAAEMAQATALVSFSRAETFSCVLLEARACGRPVVATRAGALAELFQPENAFGLLVAPDDEPALEQALTAVLAGAVQFDPARLRADVTARCTPEAVGKAFGKVYRQVLANC